MKKQIMIIISLFVLLSVLGGCYAMPEEPEQVLQKVELSAVKDGYATIMEIEPNTKYADRFEFYQNYAKNEGIGLWQYEEFANQ